MKGEDQPALCSGADEDGNLRHTRVGNPPRQPREVIHLIVRFRLRSRGRVSGPSCRLSQSTPQSRVTGAKVTTSAAARSTLGENRLREGRSQPSGPAPSCSNSDIVPDRRLTNHLIKDRIRCRYPEFCAELPFLVGLPAPVPCAILESWRRGCSSANSQFQHCHC